MSSICHRWQTQKYAPKGISMGLYVCMDRFCSRVPFCWVARFYEIMTNCWESKWPEGMSRAPVFWFFFFLSLCIMSVFVLRQSATCFSRPANLALSTVSNWAGKFNVCWFNWMVNYVRQYQIALYSIQLSYQFGLVEKSSPHQGRVNATWAPFAHVISHWHHKS